MVFKFWGEISPGTTSGMMAITGMARDLRRVDRDDIEDDIMDNGENTLGPGETLV